MTESVLNEPDYASVPSNQSSIGGRAFGADASYDRTKRLLDIFLVVVSLPIVLPVILIIALLIMLDGRSPFFLQKRVGKYGRVFTLIKLRTMVPNAELRLTEYLAHNSVAASEWEQKQKLAHDPRVTRIGKYLRATSLDELPQLFNVLTGEMSLVGPRPMMPSQRRLYPGTAYYKLVPGVTGPWQISASRNTDFLVRAKFDVEYLRSKSIATDFSILLKTISVVVAARGC